MGGLTPMHCAVIETQRKKNAKRKAIALRDGTLLPEEQADALDDAAAETIEMVKRAKKRMAETEKQQKRCSTSVSGDVLRGLPIFLESDAVPTGGLTPALTKALTELACPIVRERTMAKVIVVNDLSDMGMRTKWCAALGGYYVTLVGTLEHGRGPIVHYHEARRDVRRTLWMSPLFQERHPKVVSILQTLAFSSDAVEQHGSQWTLQDSALPTTKGAVVLIRKGEDKATVAPKGNKCYDVEGFFELISKVRALYKLKVSK